jgi:outer membrane protein W
LIFLLIPQIILSQINNSDKTEKINLKGRHSIGLNLGVINQTSAVTVDMLNVSTNLNFQASLSYNYWFTNEIAIEANAGFLNSSVNNNVSIFGVEQKTALVTPLYLGAKYYPEFTSISGNIRPYIKLLAGSVVGSSTNNYVRYSTVSDSVITQTVFSIKSGIGADALVSKNFRLGLAVDYLYMPDFEKSVGTRKNYSGVNFSFVFGAVF